MNPLIPVAIGVAPEIARWLFGESGEKTQQAVIDCVAALTGSSDPAAAASILQQNASAAGSLRLQLGQLAANLAQAARSADLDEVKKTIQAVLPAERPKQGSRLLGWSTPAISAVVLVVFGTTSCIVMLHGLPAGSETASNMLLGTLAAMATSVVSYWVGSSAGSDRKDDRLAQAGK